MRIGHRNFDQRRYPAHWKCHNSSKTFPSILRITPSVPITMCCLQKCWKTLWAPASRRWRWRPGGRGSQRQGSRRWRRSARWGRRRPWRCSRISTQWCNSLYRQVWTRWLTKWLKETSWNPFAFTATDNLKTDSILIYFAHPFIFCMNLAHSIDRTC